MKKDKLVNAFGEGPSAHNLLVEARVARAKCLRDQMSGQLESMVDLLTRKMREAEKRQLRGRQLRRVGLGALALGSLLVVVRVAFLILLPGHALPAHVEDALRPAMGLLLGLLLFPGFLCYCYGWMRGELDGW